MEGDLSLVSVPDLLQMICLGGYSRDIHLFDGPTQLGVIAVRNGRVDRCFGFGMWGQEAFYKLVIVRRGRYKVNEAQDTSASDATLTVHSWQELLMEAARQEDEAERLKEAAGGRVIAFPSPPAHAQAVAFEPAISFSEPTRESHMFSAPTAAPQMPSGPISVPVTPAPLPPSGPISVAAAPASGPITISRARTATGNDFGGEPAHPEIADKLAEATSYYLRRDLARAEEILQECLALRPGDKRVLQNLERIRRKKSP
ncbi:MAG TPA: DUF4388 domain-containing protein [Kofleriaceae bacterium]|nr:DUF4388 domain-containing protein [Kofleriaceae bacterium]